MENNEITRIKPEKSRGGEWVRIGDEEYKVPPLSLPSLREHMEAISGLASMGTAPTDAQFNVVGDVVHAALARNYPSLSREEVGEMIDIGNFRQLLDAVLLVSGFKRGGDQQSEGEPTASTGTQSTLP